MVDDEPIRWAIAETLSQLGCSIVEAGNGKSVLEIVTGASNPFEVVLLDYRLPDSDHLALLSAIRRMTPTSRSRLKRALAACARSGSTTVTTVSRP